MTAFLFLGIACFISNLQLTTCDFQLTTFGSSHHRKFRHAAACAILDLRKIPAGRNRPARAIQPAPNNLSVDGFEPLNAATVNVVNVNR